MKLTLDAGGFARELRAACKKELERTKRAVTDGVAEAAEGLKEEMRDQTFTALGLKVADAWRSKRYPEKKASLGAAAVVWTNAPRIIEFWTAERIRTPIGTAFAIPVARETRRYGKRLTVAEVESKYNQDLQAVRLPSGNIGLFADLVRAKSKRRPGERAPTARRLAQGRQSRRVLMFVLVRNIRSRKLIDINGPARRWAARVPALIEARLGAGR